MDAIEAIDARREQILAEMKAIRSMDRATLKEQMLPVKHKGKKEPVLRGPYYVLARWENGKTRSKRVSGEELERVKHDVANHREFQNLCREFEELTERLGALERESASSEATVKKGLKSRSGRAGKSSG